MEIGTISVLELLMFLGTVIGLPVAVWYILKVLDWALPPLVFIRVVKWVGLLVTLYLYYMGAGSLANIVGFFVLVFWLVFWDSRKSAKGLK